MGGKEMGGREMGGRTVEWMVESDVLEAGE